MSTIEVPVALLRRASALLLDHLVDDPATPVSCALVWLADVLRGVGQSVVR
ncbi:MAG: hypothetical protein GX593_05675 [Actinomycetales bacterium]|nr:hypothetical protein [Actinomycetales bacterium]